MNKQQHTVSTEAQRLALEAMSAQLVHKLNAMIGEQEARTRAFAEQHHTQIELPQTLPPLAEPAPETARVLPKPPPPSPTANTRRASEKPITVPEPPPLRIGPKKQTAKAEEESNIGLGMVIFSLIGIVILLRSCS